MNCCKFHDRLDMKLSVHQYTASKCGSPALQKAGDNVDREGKPDLSPRPEYCCFECPDLLAKLKA